MRLHFEPRVWCMGYYRGTQFHHVCLLPTLVLRWPRGSGGRRLVYHGLTPPRIEIMGRLDVGESVVVEDPTTGERAFGVCTGHAYDPQAAFSVVRLLGNG